LEDTSSAGNFCQSARRVGVLFLQSGWSVAANYRAACRARSRAEFVAKVASDSMVRPLLDEANQLLRIFVTSHKTASSRQTDGARRR
jgi:hypothetical protein